MKRKTSKRIVRLISFVLTLVILLSSTIVTNASTYKKDIISVVSISNKDNYNNYIDDINSMPEILTDNCNKIIFTNKNLNEKFNLGFKDCTVFAISFGKDIYVDTNYYNKNVIIHELCHVYDYSNNWISEKNDFTELYESESSKISVTEGNVQNEYEFFASSGEMYFNNPEKLKSTSYPTYMYFKNLF